MVIPGTAPNPCTIITVITPALTPQQVLTLHLSFEAGDVPVAKVFAQLLDLLQLEQMNPQHLYRADHQVVDFFVISEERLLVSLLMLDESLNVHIERLTGRTLR